MSASRRLLRGRHVQPAQPLCPQMFREGDRQLLRGASSLPLCSQLWFGSDRAPCSFPGACGFQVGSDARWLLCPTTGGGLVFVGADAAVKHCPAASSPWTTAVSKGSTGPAEGCGAENTVFQRDRLRASSQLGWRSLSEPPPIHRSPLPSSL